MTDAVRGANSGIQSIKSVASALSSVGGISSEVLSAVSMAAAMAQIFAAGAQAVRTAGVMRDVLNQRAAAEAVAKTAAETALGPVGWSNIAIALGAAAAASAVTAVIMDYTLSADLESGDGRASVSGALGGII